MNRRPVQVHARRDPDLSRWSLLIPHYVVLAGLWIAFVVTPELLRAG